MSRAGRIDSGARSRRYAVEKAVVTRGTDGSVVKTWTEEAAVYGAYKQLGGDELAYARQLVENATATITIPHRSGLQTDMRLTSGTRTWHIEHIDDGDLTTNELVLIVSEMTES